VGGYTDIVSARYIELAGGDWKQLLERSKTEAGQQMLVTEMIGSALLDASNHITDMERARDRAARAAQDIKTEMEKGHRVSDLTHNLTGAANDLKVAELALTECTKLIGRLVKIWSSFEN